MHGSVVLSGQTTGGDGKVMFFDFELARNIRYCKFGSNILVVHIPHYGRAIHFGVVGTRMYCLAIDRGGKSTDGEDVSVHRERGGYKT